MHMRINQQTEKTLASYGELSRWRAGTGALGELPGRQSLGSSVPSVLLVAPPAGSSPSLEGGVRTVREKPASLQLGEHGLFVQLFAVYCFDPRDIST